MRSMQQCCQDMHFNRWCESEKRFIGKFLSYKFERTNSWNQGGFAERTRWAFEQICIWKVAKMATSHLLDPLRTHLWALKSRKSLGILIPFFLSCDYWGTCFAGNCWITNIFKATNWDDAVSHELKACSAQFIWRLCLKLFLQYTPHFYFTWNMPVPFLFVHKRVLS